MNTRRRTVAAVLGALIAGLCFEPVFSVRSLVLPVAAVCLTVYAITELCRYKPALTIWRPLLIALAGMLAITETVLKATTVTGLPTLTSIRALGHGLTSWHLTLESTWPARPDADLVLFVPLLVLIACLLAVEFLDRTPPLVAVLPSLIVVGVSQLYIALAGLNAVLVALGYGLVVAGLLLPDRVGNSRRRPVLAAALLAVVAVVAGAVVSAVDPAGRRPYTLQQVQSTSAPSRPVANPLDELAARLDKRNQDKVVFRYKAAGPVGRWRQVALDDFDGANWSTSHPILRMGSSLPTDADVTVPVTPEHAEVELTGLDGPWLPGQLLPRQVSGVAEPRIEPIGGTLVAAAAPAKYELTWSKPTVDAKFLLRAGIEADPVSGLGDIGDVPAEVFSIADDAVAGKRATFATALALEAYMRKRYKLAVGDPLPTGHSWPQLRDFLVDDKPGTSEQFAAGYVALARSIGIPARLVVGFRAPAGKDAAGWSTVRNRDALAWPEVAVEGVGWWPLDPAGQADSQQSAVPGSAADVTDQARAEVPPASKIEDPEVAPAPKENSTARAWDGIKVPVLGIFVASASLLVLWLLGVPLLKLIRAFRRKRRTGNAAVVGAWAEARDRLRAHGVPVTSGMTVRDLALASAEVADARAQAGLAVVARSVDQALWSGGPGSVETTDLAWHGVREVCRGLRARPLVERFHAALELGTLLPRRG